MPPPSPLLIIDLDYPQGIPVENHNFEKMQKILYYGVTQKEQDFRDVFTQNLIESFERGVGPLNRDQKAKIIMEIEEECFENFEHIQTLRDVLDNLEDNYGFAKQYQKKIAVQDIEKDIKRARQFKDELEIEQYRQEKQLFDKQISDHRKFIEIGS